ncbi:MAG TPA: PHP domain-containing protein, partial [Gammaproteobacteria bacterium]|nr:PHP domain-containing protein [Gammaproteobacteria bacterium]
MNDYAELHCLSNFTFLRGASHPEELVATAATLGYAALAITDECSLAGIVRAHVAAKEHGLPLIVGTEIRVEEGHRLVLLAPDDTAYQQLCRLISRGRRRSEKGRYCLHLDDLGEAVDHCLLILIPAEGTDALPLDWLTRWHHGRAWLAVQRLLTGDEERCIARLTQLARQHHIPLVACGNVHMHVRERRPLQDILTAIRHNTPVARLGHRLFANGERHLRRRETLARLYRRAWLDESLRIAARCRFSLDSLRYDYPDDVTPPGESADDYLHRLAREGMRTHWPRGAPERVRKQVAHELGIIRELNYAPYFLTVHDIIR